MERCLDSDCQFDNREEYCYENPLVLGELGSQIPTLLDALLYDKRAAPSDAMTAITNQENFLCIRSTLTILADKSIRDWPLAQAEVVISQEVEKKTGLISYVVNISKSVLLSGANDEPFASTYNIDLMPSGAMTTEVEDHGVCISDEGELRSGAVERRPFTMYDCQQLIEILSLVDNSRGADLAA
jgi:hypothetical protein